MNTTWEIVIVMMCTFSPEKMKDIFFARFWNILNFCIWSFGRSLRMVVHTHVGIYFSSLANKFQSSKAHKLLSSYKALKLQIQSFKALYLWSSQAPKLSSFKVHKLSCSKAIKLRSTKAFKLLSSKHTYIKIKTCTDLGVAHAPPASPLMSSLLLKLIYHHCSTTKCI